MSDGLSLLSVAGIEMVSAHDYGRFRHVMFSCQLDKFGEHLLCEVSGSQCLQQLVSQCPVRAEEDRSLFVSVLDPVRNVVVSQLLCKNVPFNWAAPKLTCHNVLVANLL